MDFGSALNALKAGLRVARSGWNGKGMYLYLTKGSHVESSRNNVLDEIIEKNGACKINAHIDMKAADDSIVVGWLASQTDMLADDWFIVEK